MADHHEHGEHGEHGHSHAAAGGAVKPIGEASVGDTTKCPVSGEEFVVAADSPKAEHEGKTYYFCCAGCKKKFESDPKKFSSAK
jgi:Cu+-exporting ATPase